MIDGRNVGAVLKPGFMVAPVFDLTGCQLRRIGRKEPGREATGTSGADRPSGKRTARDSTGMGGVEPTDPEMPDMPPA